MDARPTSVQYPTAEVSGGRAFFPFQIGNTTSSSFREYCSEPYAREAARSVTTTDSVRANKQSISGTDYGAIPAPRTSIRLETCPPEMHHPSPRKPVAASTRADAAQLQSLSWTVPPGHHSRTSFTPIQTTTALEPTFSVKTIPSEIPPLTTPCEGSTLSAAMQQVPSSANASETIHPVKSNTPLSRPVVVTNSEGQEANHAGSEIRTHAMFPPSYYSATQCTFPSSTAGWASVEQSTHPFPPAFQTSVVGCPPTTLAWSGCPPPMQGVIKNRRSTMGPLTTLPPPVEANAGIRDRPSYYPAPIGLPGGSVMPETNHLTNKMSYPLRASSPVAPSLSYTAQPPSDQLYWTDNAYQAWLENQARIRSFTTNGLTPPESLVQQAVPPALRMPGVSQYYAAPNNAGAYDTSGVYPTNEVSPQFGGPGIKNRSFRKKRTFCEALQSCCEGITACGLLQRRR